MVHYSITNSGGNLAFNLVQTITQNSPGVPGSAETSDQFGAVLSAASRGVLIGDQLEDVGSTKDAGSITLLAGTDDDGRGDVAGTSYGGRDRFAGWRMINASAMYP